MDATNFANCITGSYAAATGYVCFGCKAGFSYTAVVGASSTTSSCVANTATNCTVTNCSSCNTPKVCTGCVSGYNVLGTDSSCVQSAVTNCMFAASATACSTCTYGYYITSGTCAKSAVTVFGKILSLLLVFIL
jgi:hypothetical protein